MKFQELMDGKNYRPWLSDPAGKSGVYVIREKSFFGSIVYIGESRQAGG